MVGGAGTTSEGGKRECVVVMEMKKCEGNVPSLLDSYSIEEVGSQVNRIQNTSMAIL